MLIRSPVEPTVICRSKSKTRPSLQTIRPGPSAVFRPETSSSASPFNSGTHSSKKSSGNLPNDSTGQTSLDSSKFQGSLTSKGICAPDPERKFHQGNSSGTRISTRSSPDSTLTTIQEVAIDPVTPSIVTVERTAAAKIYLETYFNEKLQTPGPRDLRLQLLEAELYARGGSLAATDEVAVRRKFYRRETEHLREMRAMKTRSIRSLQVEREGAAGCPVDDYEVVKVLGKGSFGVVRLVREKHTHRDSGYGTDGWSDVEKRQVYAMKVIRKSDMIRTSQEGHLRAERDLLVASEGSKWIVPLVASFQDTANLYLLMEYMPGGDFLGLLIRENILQEPVARFYVAEMIVCVEATHALKCIHRDIKPDNFLISASGHLKIGDFGLAFDGHWGHDTAYYSSHRYSLLEKLGIQVDGDRQDRSDNRSTQKLASLSQVQGIERHNRKDADDGGEPLLNWRNRCGIRTSALSVIGTSQYMAPEVVEGRKYDARCDWWKKFGFPARPPISHRCQHLMASLIQDRETRLCSKRYRFKDLCSASSSSSSKEAAVAASSNPSPDKKGPRDFAGRYVFPYDAEDIKAHKWFKGIPWDRLHEVEPPHIPQIRAPDDTHYFDEEDEISDWSESQTSEASFDYITMPSQAPVAVSHGYSQMTSSVSRPILGSAMGATRADFRARQREQEARAALRGLRRSIQRWALAAIATPYDTQRLHNIDIQIESFPQLAVHERTLLKHFVRMFRKREKKRPRDRLLRDRNTRGVAMEVRKKTAFLGYTWRRMRPLRDILVLPDEAQDENEAPGVEFSEGEEGGGVIHCSGDTAVGSGSSWGGLDGAGGGDACYDYGRFDFPAMRALYHHQARMSWQ
ncbi:kinase-like protein [Thozetella sp. PMI_491]|nr:kinase-like protein [Thozetella sp. PMI_491]